MRDLARILLVEDDHLSRAAMCELLADEGCQVLGVATGRAALEALGSPEHRFDVLVTDVGLPDVGGVELVRMIRELLPAMPVVVMSGRSIDDPNVAKLLREPNIAFVQKPVDIDVLIGKIDDVRNPA